MSVRKFQMDISETCLKRPNQTPLGECNFR
jgi:hypothetical protein